MEIRYADIVALGSWSVSGHYAHGQLKFLTMSVDKVRCIDCISV